MVGNEDSRRQRHPSNHLTTERAYYYENSAHKGRHKHSKRRDDLSSKDSERDRLQEPNPRIPNHLRKRLSSENSYESVSSVRSTQIRADPYYRPASRTVSPLVLHQQQFTERAGPVIDERIPKSTASKQHATSEISFPNKLLDHTTRPGQPTIGILGPTPIRAFSYAQVLSNGLALTPSSPALNFAVPQIFTDSGDMQNSPSASNRERAKSDASLSASQASSRAGFRPLSPLIIKSNIEGYQYNPLQNLEFRLVKILPETTSDVKCEIVVESLQQPPDYTALSYAWGDPDDQCKIKLERQYDDDKKRVCIEERDHRVTASLHAALKMLQQKDTDVWVWADALCINQQDVLERTKQVQLMTDIYNRAASVSIWLGPKTDDSDLALQVLRNVAAAPQVSVVLKEHAKDGGLAAVVHLFERSYWNRLWVVQEIFVARERTVHCGNARVAWDVLDGASRRLSEHRSELEHLFSTSLNSTGSQDGSRSQYSLTQVLVNQGPNSMPDIRDLLEEENPLLEVLRLCRTKLAARPQDKLYAILGILPQGIRRVFPVDYNRSIKQLYIKIVDFLLTKTGKMDVFRESIHFPMHTESAGLPTWCPDWSHISEVKALSDPRFSASGDRKVEYEALAGHRKIGVGAIEIDTVYEHGVPVGVLTTLSDHIMAFLHWRAMLLNTMKLDEEDLGNPIHDTFCKTLCLDQIPPDWVQSGSWAKACYHAFAYMARKKVPRLPLDRGLEKCVESNIMARGTQRQFLLDHFAKNMMGRCFLLTKKRKLVGLGSGFMTKGDLIIVPLGCSTPILIRPEGRDNEYRYVGDVYIDGFMYGEAIDQWERGNLKLRKYVLH